MMNRRKFNTLIGSSVAALSAPSILRAQDTDPIRFCWTNTVSVSAQTQHSMKNTDIASRNGVDLKMTQFAGSPPINEALVSNAADIGSVADFSAVLMMAAGVPLSVVSHQSYFRSAILTTKASGITKIEDLKGKSIYGLFGISAYLNAQEAVKSAGLTPGRDVNFVNIGTAELADAVRTQQIDAFFMWDPWVTLFEHEDLAQVVSQDVTPSMVLIMRDDFINKRPDEVSKLLKAHSEAMFFAANNHELSNEWFQSLEPAKSIPTDVIETSSGFDPVWSATDIKQMELSVTDVAVERMQKMAEWAYGEKLIPRIPDVASFVNTDFSSMAYKDLMATGFDPKSVKILNEKKG
ncbi:MAG: ABC transporter substrate-binding protein [Rhodobacterales bacterium]